MAEPTPFDTAFVLIALTAVYASACLWMIAARRVRHGRPVLPYEPRPAVPWNGVDLAMILLLFLGAFSALALLFDVEKPAGGDEAPDPKQFYALLMADMTAKLCVLAVGLPLIALRTGARWLDFGFVPRKIAADLGLGVAAFFALAAPVYVVQLVLTYWWGPSRHVVMKMLERTSDSAMLALLGVAVVLAAPIAEELFFRVLLQGWLEAAFARLKAWKADFAVPPGAMEPGDPQTIDPMTAASRETVDSEPYESPPMSVEHQNHQGVDSTSTERTRWPPILISSTIFALMHVGHGPDPAALLLLAIGLGYLYQRTHRVLPCIVVHMALNATSFLILLASQAK